MLSLVADQFTADGIVLEKALAFWVHRVYQSQRNEMYRAFRDAGVDLTPEQWALLVRLWERDGQSQTDLCESTFRDKPTISRMLDTLEGRGLLERRIANADARTRLVYLTRQGRALEARLVPVARRIVARMLAGVSERDLSTTRRTLQQIFANLEA